MRHRDPGSRSVALGVLFLDRAVYAFNWYNIGAVLPLVRARFGVGPVELGVVLAAFLLGAGIFQLPAGFAALRWGNRTTSIAALAGMAACTLASAAAPRWPVLALLRFGAGAGAAFFFAPALGLATSYFPAGTRGPVIGVYNAGFSLGSGVSLVAGAAVGVAFGWAWALAVGGLLLVAGTVAAIYWLPAEAAGRPAPPRAPRGPLRGGAVVRSRPLWALALATSGIWAAFYVAAQYFVEYASTAHAGWSLPLAATVPTVMIFAEILGGPIGGWFGERGGELRRLLAGWGLAAGIGIALIPLYSFEIGLAVFAFLGFADGVVFALLYLVPTYLPGIPAAEFPLALGLLNSIQIFVGSALAILFGIVASGLGYPAAWVLAGVLAGVPLVLLRELPPSRGMGRRDSGRKARGRGLGFL